MAKTKKPPKKPLQNILATVLFEIMKNALFRVFLLPLYAVIAAPWLFALFMGTSQTTQDKAHRIVSFLAGKPSNTTLNESDIALAVFVAFMLLEVMIVVVSMIKNRSFDPALRRKLSAKQKMYIECGLIIVGWGVMASLYPDATYEVYLIAAALAICSCAFMWGKYAAYLAHQNAKKFGLYDQLVK